MYFSEVRTGSISWYGRDLISLLFSFSHSRVVSCSKHSGSMTEILRTVRVNISTSSWSSTVRTAAEERRVLLTCYFVTTSSVGALRTHKKCRGSVWQKVLSSDESCFLNPSSHLVMLLSFRWRVISWWRGLRGRVGTELILFLAMESVCSCAEVQQWSISIIFHVRTHRLIHWKPWAPAG